MSLESTALFLLTEHRAGRERLMHSLLLNTLIRHVPHHILYVSSAAQAEADRRDIGDLREYTWYDQLKRMGDVGRKTFAWDHFFPVAELRRQLDALEEPTPAQVRGVLEKASIAWILKSEDRELNRLGYRHRRPDPHAAYRAAGIQLLSKFPEHTSIPRSIK